MVNFNLQSHLDRIYSVYPEANRKPIIGITSNYANSDVSLREVYYRQIMGAGGIPIIIPPIADKDVIINTLDKIDGLLLTGGADYNPLWAGEQPSLKLGNINAERDLPELIITRLAYNRQIPMLGICRGIQTLAMALGGKVKQDIESGAKHIPKGSIPYFNTFPDNLDEALAKFKAKSKLVKHSQDADKSECTHSVDINKHSTLYNIYGEEQIFVNSFHHQAVGSSGDIFRVAAIAPDGVIEAIESAEFKSIIGVQWHPEWLGEEGLPLFKWLVEQAAEFCEVKNIHSRVLTLDSHCDTPMFFSQGIDFTKRDNRILVDLHKMTDGLQDAVTMVTYLPQPKAGEKFTDKVSFDVAGPKEYADLIFDKIEVITEHNSNHVRIARTPTELYENKHAGCKSIMLGIENGLALNGDLDNVGHFARRGIVYITLCHNGDNEICDSARGNDTHGGVSDFGEQVIREMNRLGIMVDLSHGAEKSFYDALEISSTPIVCSHSNCKALCDVPRNLTDDQLRAIAAKGGVVQITLYHGFLREEGEADINDVMAHLDHAVKIMGIDHVGLGTDFDGDGGIRGLANSSELINFTKQLLQRKYNEQEIEKIWSGNWLRVMKLAQKYKEE